MWTQWGLLGQILLGRGRRPSSLPPWCPQFQLGQELSVARIDEFSRKSKNADFHETVPDFLKMLVMNLL